jgi:hypothetical protein
VKGQLGLIVDVDLEGLGVSFVLCRQESLAHRLHELFTGGSDLLGEGGGEHHDLLVVGSSSEDLLDVSSHVCRVRLWPKRAESGSRRWRGRVSRYSSELGSSVGSSKSLLCPGHPLSCWPQSPAASRGHPIRRSPDVY